MANVKGFSRILKWAVSVLLCIWVVRKANLTSPEALMEYLELFKGVNVYYLILAIIIVPVMDVVSTIKWRALAEIGGVKSPYLRLLKFYLIGRFFSLVLPSGIGGDLIRIHLHNREHSQLARVSAVVLVERVSGLIILLLLAAISSVLMASVVVDVRIVYLLIAFSLAIVAALIVLISDRAFSLSTFFVKGRIAFLDKIINKFDSLRTAVKSLASDNKALLVAFFTSVLFYSFAILNGLLSIRVFDPDVAVYTMILAVPIIMMLMNIPLSIGNIGVMEFAYVSTISAFGMPVELGLTLALFMRFKSLLAAGLGGLLFYGSSDHEKNEDVKHSLEKLSETKKI